MEFSIFGILAVVLELVRPILLPLALVILVDLVLLARVIGRHQVLNISSGIITAAGLGVLLGIAAALYFPIWTGASLTHLQSGIDYLGVIGAGIGIGIASGMILYPPVQLLMRKTA
ncbi:hypothetical protein [Spiribacter insolitus]|uniref:Uncharacterized protein n=1 Tax=Spiribacter insolitus TaxID=3122417 RepID=A0ABV3T794_9GAMM